MIPSIIPIPEPTPLSDLRALRWTSLPHGPGVYWWFFPPASLDDLRIHEHCPRGALALRQSRLGQVCLYHGLANNLSQRVAWHAAQKLTASGLRSGFLSTFRLTLLALNQFDYAAAEGRINQFFDGLSVAWIETSTREAAEAFESAELHGPYRYPLNIQSNHHPELAAYTKHLKTARKAYRHRHAT